MNKVEYDAWCWDNRKIFLTSWESVYDYYLRLFGEETDVSNRCTLIQTQPVSFDCAHIRKTITFNLCFDEGIFTRFLIPLFKGIQENEIEFIIGNNGYANHYILKKMGDTNTYALDYLSNARGLSELLKLLSSDLDFSVFIRGENWTISSEIYGNLINPNGISQRLDDMILHAKKDFFRFFEEAQDFLRIYFKNIIPQKNIDDLISEIEKNILEDTGISKRIHSRNEISYFYSQNQDSEYMQFVKSSIRNCTSDEDMNRFNNSVFSKLLEKHVIDVASVFSPEIVYLCKQRMAYFFENELSFQRTANIMNDIVGMEQKRKENDSWLNDEDGRGKKSQTKNSSREN